LSYHMVAIVVSACRICRPCYRIVSLS
jgi:hypothetical protein